MNSKLSCISRLEEKLAEYERTSSITNDAELLYALDRIIEEQNALPPSEKDAVLMDEAVCAVLSLRGEDLQSLEKLSGELAAKHIASKRKKHPSVPMLLGLWRRGVAIAAALTVIIITSVIGFSAGYSWLNEYIDRVTAESSGELVATSMSIEYSSIEDMVTQLGIEGVLLPWKLPDGMEYRFITAQISYAKPIEGEEFVYSCIFDIRTSGESSWQEVWIETENLGAAAEGEGQQIGGREVTYYLDGTRHCAFFRLGGYTYSVSATEYSELEEVLTSLK